LSFFDQTNIFFTFLNYPLSYLEFFGVITGGVAVWLSAKGNIWSWPIGLVNVFLLFFLFFQIQLYPDMFLQVFFFITNLIGWWRWANPRPGEEDRKKELRVSWMSTQWLIIFSGITILGTALMGSTASRLHEWFPVIFSQPSAFPYLDSLVSVASIMATYLMVQKKVECWLTWILVDVVATGLYLAKGVAFLGIEYFVFCLIAAYGFYGWRKEYKHYPV
jgi:nicotinamide mononucleotide transporter